MDGLEIVLVELVWAMFVMLRDARVVPIFFLYSACVLFPPEVECAIGLADVCCCGCACAGVFVDAFFLVRVRVGFVAAA